MKRQLDDDAGAKGPSLATKVTDILPEEVDIAIEQLGDAVSALLALHLPTQRRERHAAAAALMAGTSGPPRPLLVEAWRTRPEDVEPHMVRMASAPGMTDIVAKWRATLDRLSKAANKGLVVHQGGEGAVSAARTQTFHVGEDKVTVTVPSGWMLDDSGVYRLVQVRGPEGLTTEPKQVAPGPILLTRCFREPAGGLAEYVEMAWRKPGHPWKTTRVGRGVIASARELCALAHHGVPVTSETAGQVVAWLAALEAASELAPGWVSTRMGWQGSKSTHFLLGRRLMAPGEARSVEIELLDDDDAGLHATANALRPKGSWDGWLDGLDEVAERPLAWAAVYASCAAPLLAIVGCPGWIADFHFAHGAGKSTVLRLAGSVWGDPGDERGLKRSWSTTEAGVESYAEAMQSMPLLMDETNNVPERDRPALATRIYMLANGTGKLRGAAKGSRRIKTWRTVVVSTGEQSVKSFSEDGGVHGRVVSLYGAPMGSALQAERLNAATDRHHGHLGPRLLEVLVEMKKAEREELVDRYQAVLEAYGEEMTTATGRRVAQYLAVMRLAADLIHDRCGVPRPACRPMEAILQLADEGAKGGDRAAVALREVWGWAMSHPGQMATWGGIGRFGEDRAVRPAGPRWLGRYEDSGDWKWVALQQDVVRERLKSHGHSPDAILSQWRERGWLNTRKDKRATYPVALPGSDVRHEMIAATKQALIVAGVLE